MREKKYVLAGRLYEQGWSYYRIAQIIYNPKTEKELQRAKLKTYALVQYYNKRKEKLYQDKRYTNINDDEEILFDDAGGVRNTEQWKPFFQHPTKREKEYLNYDEQVRADLEEVLYHIHDELFKDYNSDLKYISWGMVRWANNQLYKVYNRRTGGSPRTANYPRLLAYVYVVYFVALHQHYPHLLNKVRKIILERLNRRSINRYNKYLQQFLQEAGKVLALQHVLPQN